MSDSKTGPAPTEGEHEIHSVSAATSDETACCRCADPIAPGETIHRVVRTDSRGETTYRQATHLRHLRG